MTVLRDYQSALMENVSAGWRVGHRRMLAQMPTGAGKGRVLGAAAARVAARGKRILLMAHRAELIDQICANLDDEDVQYGRIMPGWPMQSYPVQVGMVQTIAKRLDRIQPPDLLLIDEAHHSPAGQYTAITAAFPRARVLGVTATPQRTDGKGLDEHFDAMVQGPSMAELIAAGHLADYDYYLPRVELDLSSVRKQAGDYATAETLDIMARAKIVGDAVLHYRQFLDGKPAIAFCMGVQHCIDTAAEFCASGIRSAHVDGKMDATTRRERLAGLAAGQIDVLTAAEVISEGVDIPAVAGAILLRPTCSVILHLQQVGRALRPKPDGSRAVILDHVGNANRHGLPADPRKWSLAGAGKHAPDITTCETCRRVFRRGEARETAAQECRVSECLMQAAGRQSAERDMTPEYTDGVLEAVRDSWAWAGGIDPARAAGAEFNALVQRALADIHAADARLTQISRARGYRRGWKKHVLAGAASSTPPTAQPQA